MRFRTGTIARWIGVCLLALGLAAPGCLPREAEQRVPIGRLPGAPEFDAALRRELSQALARRGSDYRSRTHHLRADGTPEYTNRLILTASPYLLQHAHNPVDWYPWGSEAFERARRENRPLLLSVGYSTCHWCHVMEEESFEDLEIATYLNAHYVAVKVDREERPDVDSIYMGAVQALTGSGGWPMTVWLTPERQPFFGGTYFPPRDGDRGAAVGFLSLLRQLRDAFDREPLGVAQRAAALTAHVVQLAAPRAGDGLPGPELLHAAFEQHEARFDSEHGGFGRAPKFPTPVSLDFLLRYHRRTGNPRALAMVTRTLEKMAAGGIRDHVGGGFHRYATDRAWMIPHFEKMLYDNAQLASVYLDAYQVTRRRDFADVVRETLDYLAREMTAPGGGLYAATDADSEGEEGKFFVWTPAEIAAVLDAEQRAAVMAYYGVTERGNFEGKNILHTARTLAAAAAELETTPVRVQAVLYDARQRLYRARSERIPPHRDTKILAAWNGLAISAFARAGAVLGNRSYVEHARAAATFVLAAMRSNGRLQRSHAEGRAHFDGYLEDYAFVAAGLLDLYEATFELRWLQDAIALQDALAERFWDDAGGGFFMTSSDREAPLAREKPDDDGALPSGNAIAAENLLRLAEFTTDDRYRGRGAETLRAFALRLEAAPMRAPRLLGALEFLLDRPKEIVIVHPERADGTRNAQLLATVRQTYLPNRMLTVAAEGKELNAQAKLIPLVVDKRALRGVSTAYVCEQGVCALPTGDVAVLTRQLARVHPLGEAPAAEPGAPTPGP